MSNAKHIIPQGEMIFLTSPVAGSLVREKARAGSGLGYATHQVLSSRRALPILSLAGDKVAFLVPDERQRDVVGHGHAAPPCRAAGSPSGGSMAAAQRDYGRTLSGRCTKAFWYIPAVERWVNSEEDTLNGDGVRVRHVATALEAALHAPAGREGGRAAAPSATPKPTAPAIRPAKPPLRETRLVPHPRPI